MTVKLSDFELGWLVGLLEGEGSFDYNGCSQIIQLNMTDEDAVRTYASLLQKVLGKEVKVKEFQINRPNNKMQWRVVICGDNARRVMKLVSPYMHYRRRAKIWQSLNKWPERKRKSESSNVIKMRAIS